MDDSLLNTRWSPAPSRRRDGQALLRAAFLVLASMMGPPGVTAAPCAPPHSYGPEPLQQLDVHTTAAAAAPIIVFFHGGGWRSGDKEDLRAAADFWSRQGVLFVAPNYRVAPGVLFPAQIDDAAAALAWVAAHAHDCGGDPDRIVLAGHSAGAHLASLLATRREHLAAREFSGRIRGLVLLSGVYEIKSQPGGASEAFVASVFGPDRDAWAAASPLHAVTTAAEALRRMSILVAYGEAEHPLAVVENRNWISALATAGMAADVVALPGAAHAQVVDSLIDPAGPVVPKLRAMLGHDASSEQALPDDMPPRISSAEAARPMQPEQVE